jgi:ribosomal peptide maturation radical SAM protein 1
VRITLVCMPWHSLDWPSLALGVLHRQAKDCQDKHDISEYFGNLRWAEYLLEASRGSITPGEYSRVSDIGIFLGMGDWIFTPALYDVPDWQAEEYGRYLGDRGIDPGLALEMQRLAPGFVERAVAEILALDPDLVGFTTTFMQNVPSLAVARRLKASRPDLLTVFGGGNCDGAMGVALHRNFPFVDFVVRGEGEQPFVELLDAVQGRRDLSEITGLCWRSPAGPVANCDRVHPYPIERVPEPDYDAYFATLEQSPLHASLEPKIVLEAARGCWWGEKHHCTFCGLNGSLMKFRSKSPRRVWQEMSHTVRKYRSLDIIMVDNILDLRYFKTLLPEISASGWDLRLHYEVKSNMTSEQVQALKAAQIAHIQPGIESLNSRVLRIMRKGVTGAHNVQLLRDAEEHGLTVSWNYLYGFPGEHEDDYATIIEQFPALVHLQPPQGVSALALERFSPYFDDPSLGFGARAPADFYRFIYDLPEAELMDLVYLFETAGQGISGEIESRLQQAIAEWRRLYLASSLTYRDDGRRLVIRDARANRAPATYVFEDAAQVAMYRALRRNHSLPGLQRALGESGLDVPLDGLERFAHELQRLGLVFEDAGLLVALATHDDPSRERVAI